jgi:hypothetical protein
MGPKPLDEAGLLSYGFGGSENGSSHGNLGLILATLRTTTTTLNLSDFL